jgi:chromosomal replication initiator protein
MSKVMMKDLLPIVAEYYGVPTREILGASRRKEFAMPRMVFCWMCRLYLEKTYPEIGRFLNRDHTTILHAARTCREKKYIDMELSRKLFEKAGGDPLE